MTVDRAEAELEVDEQRLAADERLFPGIHGNPYMPQAPTPPQKAFLGAHSFEPDDGVFEGLFGGAAGPGKSSALLMAAAQFVHEPTFAALILRRTFADLSKPGAIMDRAKEWWIPLGVRWQEQSHTFTFPSGAKVAFGYLQHAHDHLQYQGSELQFTGWDELTQFPSESQYLYIARSRVRRNMQARHIPLRSLSASNPGGPGHQWVRDRFVGDPQTGVEAPHFFLPGRLRDNPFIDQDTYVESLMHLHPTVREQLLNGDWSARDPGDYFRAEWFGPLLDPETDTWDHGDCVRVRWWDLAASEKEDAARTAGVRMARHRNGVRAVEHARAFRATPGKRDDLIAQTAHADGRTVVVGLEVEGGSGGIAQVESLTKRLKAQGFRVVALRPKAEQSRLESRVMTKNLAAVAAKAGRADPVAACLERGYQRRGEGPNTGGPWWGADADLPVEQQRDGLRLFAGQWVTGYLDEIEGFPPEKGGLCDLVDATSGAWAYLESHPFAARPAATEQRGPVVEVANVHPVLRDEWGEAEKDARGRWRVT